MNHVATCRLKHKPFFSTFTLNLCISFLERLLSPSRWMQLNGEIHQSCFLISDLHQVTSLDRAASGSSIRKSPSVLLDRRLLSSESGHLVLAAVFTSSMPRSNCPQMFFKCNLPGARDCKVLIAAPVTVYILVRLPTQHPHKSRHTDWTFIQDVGLHTDIDV